MHSWEVASDRWDAKSNSWKRTTTLVSEVGDLSGWTRCAAVLVIVGSRKVMVGKGAVIVG